MTGVKLAGLCCLTCGAELERVRQAGTSCLNADQFDADKAGDYFTKCQMVPGCEMTTRGHSGLAYFHKSEVATP